MINIMKDFTRAIYIFEDKALLLLFFGKEKKLVQKRELDAGSPEYQLYSLDPISQHIQGLSASFKRNLIKNLEIN